MFFLLETFQTIQTPRTQQENKSERGAPHAVRSLNYPLIFSLRFRALTDNFLLLLSDVLFGRTR